MTKRGRKEHIARLLFGALPILVAGGVLFGALLSGCDSSDTLLGQWRYAGMYSDWSGWHPPEDQIEGFAIDELHINYSNYYILFEDQLFEKGEYHFETVTYADESTELVVFTPEGQEIAYWLDGRYYFGIHNGKLSLSGYRCYDCGYTEFTRINGTIVEYDE